MKRLVVIDSDPKSRNSLQAIFGEDYSMAMAATPADAQPLLEEDTDVLIIEMTPPDQEERRLLRTLPESIPVLALSGTPGISNGIDLIVKPFDSAAIRSKVDELCKKRRYFPIHQNLNQPLTLEEAVNNFERSLIVRALEKSNGIQTKAAKLLGTTRRILRYRMDKLGIEVAPRKQS